MKTIYERLDEILPKISDDSFRKNKGLGNEIGYHIFDYEPQYEMLVREHIEYIKDKVNNSASDFRIKEFDLYEIMLDILNEKGYLLKTIDMEKSRGSDNIIKPIKNTLRLTQGSDLVVRYIVNRVEPGTIVFLTGVGKVWPIIRSHTILNSLHAYIDQVPVVMFFPGTYDGLELILFDEIKDDNYYRAFKLVERY